VPIEVKAATSQPQKDFNKGAAKKFVIDPQHMVKAALFQF
jgi:hypothetical protein